MRSMRLSKALREGGKGTSHVGPVLTRFLFLHPMAGHPTMAQGVETRNLEMPRSDEGISNTSVEVTPPVVVELPGSTFSGEIPAM